MISELVQRADAVAITGVRLFERNLALRRPLVTSQGRLVSRESLLVELVGIAGGAEVSGFGEASPLPGWGAQRYRDVRFDALRLREGVEQGGLATGADAMRAVRPASLRFAVESALLDIVAKGAGKPLRRLVDPDAPSSIALNATIGICSASEASEEGARLVTEGFGTLKLKVGDPDDIERVAAVRERVGSGVRLRLDANGAWTPDVALARLERFSELGIQFVEQPCAEVEDVIDVARESHVEVAADESCVDLYVAGRLIREKLVGAVVLKPALLGGWRDLVPWVELAHRNGVEVVFTSAIDGIVGRWAVAQFAAALLGRDMACGLATGDWLRGDVSVEEVIRDGRLYLGSNSGLGFQPQLLDPMQ